MATWNGSLGALRRLKWGRTRRSWKEDIIDQMEKKAAAWWLEQKPLMCKMREKLKKNGYAWIDRNSNRHTTQNTEQSHSDRIDGISMCWQRQKHFHKRSISESIEVISWDLHKALEPLDKIVLRMRKPEEECRRRDQKLIIIGRSLISVAKLGIALYPWLDAQLRPRTPPKLLNRML